jgi:flagellin
VAAQYAAGNGTAQFTSRTAGAVTLSNTLYGSTGVVAALTEPVTAGTAGAVTNVASAGTSGVYTASSTKGTLELNSAATFSIGGNSPSIAGLGSANVTLTNINTVDISTAEGANAAIALMDGALSQVTSIRGDLGAVQNRFESTISNLMSTSENISAAQARIMDADFAAESANLTKAQILQQAGLAMLAQANTVPQAALTLLQG